MAKVLMRVIICLLCCLLNANSFATVKSEHMETIKKVEQEIKKQEREIKSFASDINRIENLLTKNNQNYLEVQDEKEMLLRALEEVEVKRKILNQEVKKNEVVFQKLVKGMILVHLGHQEDAASLLEKKIISSTILRIKKEQKTNVENLQTEEKKLEQINTDYQKKSKIEQELLIVLSELEELKKDSVQNYLNTQARNEELVRRVQKLSSNVGLKKMSPGLGEVASQNLKNIFQTPIEDFVKIEYDKKGVTFFYRGTKEVKAPRMGKIVYSGELASYGNVIMIDHGDNERSVLLGDFNARVKKGHNVRASQTIAYTKDNLVNSKIYFEVRKENQVQNTIHLLDKNSKVLKENMMTHLKL